MILAHLVTTLLLVHTIYHINVSAQSITITTKSNIPTDFATREPQILRLG